MKQLPTLPPPPPPSPFSRLYGVVVDSRPDDISDLNAGYPNIGPYTRGATYYLAAAWSDPAEVPSTFTVGDGTTTEVGGVVYWNAPLNAGVSYGLVIRVEIVSDNGEPLITHSAQMSVNTPLGYSPAGAAIGTLLLIAAIAAAVVGVVLGLLWYR